MAGDAATPRTPPDKRAQTRKDVIAALPLPIPGTAALAPSVADGVSARPVPIPADGAPIDGGSAAAPTGEPGIRVPAPRVLPHDAMPAAIDTMPAHVTDSGPDRRTEENQVSTAAARQTAIVHPL